MSYQKLAEDSTENYDLNTLAGNTQRGKVFIRDGWMCRYCGKKLRLGHNGASDIPEVDHVIPRLQGGRSTMKNLVTTCKSCNRKKMGKTPEQAGMTLLEIPRTA